jgi:hypothetical protein
VSKRRAVEPEAAVVSVEALARFKHDDIDRRPGDVIEMSAAEAAELIDIGFARPAPEA